MGAALKAPINIILGGDIMKERKKFKKALNDYYKHLLIRFNKGSDYIDKHDDDVAAIKEWKIIKEELKLIESMIILYDD